MLLSAASAPGPRDHRITVQATRRPAVVSAWRSSGGWLRRTVDTSAYATPSTVVGSKYGYLRVAWAAGPRPGGTGEPAALALRAPPREHCHSESVRSGHFLRCHGHLSGTSAHFATDARAQRWPAVRIVDLRGERGLRVLRPGDLAAARRAHRFA